MQAELRKEKKERKSLERKNARLQEKLDFANKNRFGSKSQKVEDHVPAKDAESSDRTQDDDNFDGTPGSISSEMKAEPAGKDVPSKERDMSNRPDSYSRMGQSGGRVEIHMTDRSKVPGRIIESDAPKMVRVFSLRMSLVEERFELVHYVPKGGKPRWDISSATAILSS